MSQPYPPQGYPQQPQQPAWPTQQPQYAPAQPYPPQGYPQQYTQPPQGYQAYGQPMAPPEPPPVFVQGTLDAFYAQPSAGQGGGLKFPGPGAAHIIIVNRAVVDSDTEQQTDMNDRTKPSVDKKGQPRLVLKVPVNVVVSQDNPEGKAKWYVQGSARDDLGRAMQMAGAPLGPPEPGSAVYVGLKGKRKAGNFMANDWDVRYWRPADAVQIAAQNGIEYPALGPEAQQAALASEAQAAQAQPPVQGAAAYGPANGVIQQQAPNGQQYGHPQGQQMFQAPPQAAPPPPQVQQYVQPPAPPLAAPPAQAPVAPQAPVQPPPPAGVEQLPQDKQALYAQLTGGTPA